MRLALCQLNPRVGDVDGNADQVVRWTEAAAAAGADMALFPEATISGYPAEDLLHKPHFLSRCRLALEWAASEVALPALVGWPEAVPAELDDHFEGTPEAWNSASVLAGGNILATYRKLHLPNYAVFDEKRYFRAGERPLMLNLGGTLVGITVCEDAWVPQHPGRELAGAGAQLIVNLSASPYRLGRGNDRERLLCGLARQTGVPIALCNLVGGQDELVFDGHSLVVDADGQVLARAGQFHEELVVVEIPTVSRAEPQAQTARALDLVTISHRPASSARARVNDWSQGEDRIPVRSVAGEPQQDPLSMEGEVWGALRLGLGDYVRKNGFEDVVLGLSGGIDSAVVLALAVDAFGADRVHTVTMPSRYTSSGTRGDAHEMAQRLGVELLELPIEPVVSTYAQVLAQAEPFSRKGPDVTEENLQARIRGNLLMALSNKLGWLVLTTGNKSEVSVGYMTLYGDMAGGFAPIKDVPKTLVFALSRWRNEQAAAADRVEPIPLSIIERPPSAELAADQQDTDSLPPYERLDPLLQLLVERDHGVEEAVASGVDRALAERVQRMVDRAEYKRRQSPPGIRITAKAFGRDRRMPITNGFDGKIAPAAELRRPAGPLGDG